MAETVDTPHIAYCHYSEWFFHQCSEFTGAIIAGNRHYYSIGAIYERDHYAAADCVFPKSLWVCVGLLWGRAVVVTGDIRDKYPGFLLYTQYMIYMHLDSKTESTAACSETTYYVIEHSSKSIGCRSVRGQGPPRGCGSAFFVVSQPRV